MILLQSMSHLPVISRLSILEQFTTLLTRIAARNQTILAGIIKLQKGSKAGSWPLMFTVSILNQKMRNQPIAWKSLGYIFYLSMIQSQADAKGRSQDLKAERLHAVFQMILKETGLSKITTLVQQSTITSSMSND
jgi:hypothetical protein